MGDPVEQPFCQEGHGVARVGDANSVELGIVHQELFTQVFNPHLIIDFRIKLVVLKVKQGIVHYWDGGEHDIIQLVNERLIEDLCTEYRPKSKDILSANIQNILVESVEHQQRVSPVCFSAVNKHQGLQVPELTDREVGSSSSL